MKSVRLVFVLTIVLMFTQVKSQTLLVSGRFLNSNDLGVLADYKLNCDGKTVHSGQSTGKIELSLNVNKTYVLIVSNENFKTETLFFSIKPELNRDQYIYEFDIHLKEKNPLPNPHVQKENYNSGIDHNSSKTLGPKQI